MKRTAIDWSFIYERPESLIGFIIFILGMLVTFIWTILKLTGIINTPLWQEVLPYWTATFAVAGGIFGIGISHGEIRKDLQILKQQNKLIFHKLDDHDKRFDRLENEIKDLKHDFRIHLVKYHHERA